MAKMVRYSSDGGEWSALYVDGELDRVGDHYLVDERISELAGVETICSDDFLQGGNTRKDVAVNLEELNDYTDRKNALLEAAEAKKSQAAELMRQAQALVDEVA